MAGATGLWLASLPHAWRLASGQWLFWLPAALLLGGGLYACLAGVFLYRRHGQVALTLTPESIAFANAPQVPMYTFQSLEIERGRWLELTFATTFDCTAPSFDNHARFDPRAFARQKPVRWPAASGSSWRYAAPRWTARKWSWSRSHD